MARPAVYFPVGNGRDTYIANNNGGFYTSHKPGSALSSGAFRTSQRPRSALCNLGTKRSHYHCNGTGRDNYVLKADTPTYQFSQAETIKNFVKDFRTYRTGERPYDYAKPIATKEARAISKVTPTTVDSFLAS